MSFSAFELNRSDTYADLSTEQYPSRFSGWNGALELTAQGHHFGFVYEGKATIESEQGTLELGAGMYFSEPGACRVSGGRGVVMTRLDWRGLRSVGGPVEERGRLRYIDGCTDSLLVAPVRLGDPCLNLLHIPAGTRQTSHTHPSMRSGVIVSGRGRCVTPEGDAPLSPGLAFVISTGTEHAFHTDEEDLRVIAYHPDSDYGPTDEVHPMINRTVVSS